MTIEEPPANAPHPLVRLIARKDVLAGLMFMVVAGLGLWISREYPIGTALRMGTGYVPRLLCWILLGLGAAIFIQGLRVAPVETVTEIEAEPKAGATTVWRPLIFVTLSLVVFGLTIERLGLVVSILLLTCIGAVAARGLRPIETLIAALFLILLSWGIFILGLGLTIPVWPEW